ncbi:MAG: dephospho-CoA kinase [Steroidobacteraceae bacterium]
MPAVPRIALTGGVASGKSTAAQLFAALGAKLIDTDQIAREVVTPPSPVLDRIVARFGADLLTPAGTLDRARLRSIVFADAAARADLEALTHPAIRATLASKCTQLGGPYQLIAVPLLLETATWRDYDRVLVVDADPQTQLLRLMQRDGIDENTARNMLGAQADRAERNAIADDIIANNGDIAALAAQIETLHRRYLSLPARNTEAARLP